MGCTSSSPPSSNSAPAVAAPAMNEHGFKKQPTPHPTKGNNSHHHTFDDHRLEEANAKQTILHAIAENANHAPKSTEHAVSNAIASANAEDLPVSNNNTEVIGSDNEPKTDERDVHSATVVSHPETASAPEIHTSSIIETKPESSHENHSEIASQPVSNPQDKAHDVAADEITPAEPTIENETASKEASHIPAVHNDEEDGDDEDDDETDVTWRDIHIDEREPSSTADIKASTTSEANDDKVAVVESVEHVDQTTSTPDGPATGSADIVHAIPESPSKNEGSTETSAAAHPAMKVGYISKEGGNFKTYKKRWFVLRFLISDNKSKITWYKSPSDNEPFGEEHLGELDLTGYELIDVNSTSLKLKGPLSSSRDLLLIFDGSTEAVYRQEWIDALNGHLAASNNANGPAKAVPSTPTPPTPTPPSSAPRDSWRLFGRSASLSPGSQESSAKTSSENT